MLIGFTLRRVLLSCLCDPSLGYMYLIGGALLLKPKEFVKVNGFSNQFYGWGGEDDDMFKRYIEYFLKN